MELFWERGYEATTLEDIKAAMGGIGSPSFYAAFGSKEALFLEAVELYRASDGSTTSRALADQPTARAAVEAVLREAVASFTRGGVPAGCLVVLGAMNGSPASKRVQEHLKELRLQTPTVIEKRLERGITDGDLRTGIDTAAVAAFYTTVLHGLTIQARDGASRDTLSAVVDGAMAAWKVLTRP
ncbi:TetR/AcrR family transcriptional regulator [Frigoriglobus tundricola]|nr:TetR/AcrR family transcriptional regulator [Frigoriglobus tundricola]